MTTTLCSACPIHWFCELTGQLRTEADDRLLRRNWELAQDNSRLREIMIENGINYGGSVYVGGKNEIHT